MTFVLLLGLGINLIPDSPPQVLTPKDGWQVSGRAGLVRIEQFPDQFRQVRGAISNAPDAILYRSWTPEAGVQPIEVTSPPFRVPPRFAVAVTGATRTPSGKNSAFLSCSTHAQTRPIFLGSVNVNVMEAIVTVPPDWCPGDGRIHLVAGDKDQNVGIGTAFTVSWLHALKLSIVGQFPHLAVALGVLIMLVVAGAAATMRLGLGALSLPMGLAFAGLFALFAFYGRALLPGVWGLVVTPAGFATALLALTWAGRQRALEAMTEVRPFVLAWAVGAFAYFTLAMVGSNGLGHWDPNYRFWPATWSSDNELPWLLSEALRRGTDLAGLYGGGWKPTDRPPLMAGFHLVVSDITGLLQAGDLRHLRGAAYNTAAIALSSSWIPLALWLLVRGLRIRFGSAASVVILLGMLPFAIFNSIYGWPKGLGAAFGLAATAVAVWMVRDVQHGASLRAAVLFGVLSALSLLAHTSNALFLFPLGVWLLIGRLRSRPAALLAGIGAGIALLATWRIYQSFALPSHDPVTRYALIGDYGFGEPSKSVLSMLADLYAGLDVARWIEIKVRMLGQPLWPLSTSIVPVGLNSDFGANGLAALRAWDSILLSAGNAALVIGGIYAWLAHRRVRTEASEDRLAVPDLALGRLLVTLSACTWVLLALLFMAPLILHHWPYTAVFALGVGGLGVLIQHAPRLFWLVAFATTLYVGQVWILSPLTTLIQIDWIALTLFVLLGILLARWLFLADAGDSNCECGGTALTTPRADRRPDVQFVDWTVTWAGARSAPTAVSPHPQTRRVLQYALALLAAGLLVYAGASSLRPLIDDHSFRQTQTAISVYYMLRGEGWIGYITPVLGWPWTIPFEAPVYHWSVALLAWLLPLELSGRLVSAFYMLGSVYVGFRFMRLVTPRHSAAPLLFAVLALAAPLHLFWGRAFLIESCALFFGVAYLYFAFRHIQTGGAAAAFVSLAAGALCVLAKATTWPGFAIALALCVLWHGFVVREFRVLRLAATGLIGVAVLLVALAWTGYSDSLKMQSAFGSHLTSASLQGWNFGALALRFGKELWAWSLPTRIMPDVFGGLWPLLIFPAAYVLLRVGATSGTLFLCFAAAFLAPLLLFTNLHLVHNYYQMANAMFGSMAAAVCIAALIDRSHVVAGWIFAGLLLLGQGVHFANAHWARSFAPNAHDEIVDASRWIGANSRPDAGMLAIGVEWSPIAHYYAGRKGLAFATWFPDAQVIGSLDDLQKSFGGMPLGSILDCRAMKQGRYSETQERRFDASIAAFRASGEVLEKSHGKCIALVRK